MQQKTVGPGIANIDDFFEFCNGHNIDKVSKFGSIYIKKPCPLQPFSCCLSLFELLALLVDLRLEGNLGISPFQTGICQSHAAFPHTRQILGLGDSEVPILPG